MSDSPTTPDPRRIRRWAFSAVLIVVLALVAEGLGRIAYRVTEGEWFSRADSVAARESVVAERRQQAALPDMSEDDSGLASEILHPYLGYVVNYRDPDCPDYGFCDRRMREYPQAPMTPAGDDDFVVVVTGGSFAYGVSISSSEGRIAKRLREIPGLESKHVIVHTISHGGYKQPQQLMALNWFLSLDAPFDLVLNIDGFNEVALPPSENLPRFTSPYFPRMWYNRVTVNRDVLLLSRYGEIEYYRDQRARAAARANRRALSHSVLYEMFWQGRNARLVERIGDLERQAQNYRLANKHILPFVARGPAYAHRGDDPELYRDLARNWRLSSQQMHAVARARGVAYYHFLQPNQYLEGSKPMGAAERTAAIFEWQPYATGVVNGYPVLREEGERLAGSGVPFFDMTQMFADNEEHLYIDACCHLNRRGYDLFIDAMFARIGDDLSQRVAAGELRRRGN